MTTRTRTTRTLLAAAALAASALLVACGAPSTAGSSGPEQPSVGDLYSQVRTTSLAAKSGHLSGTVTQAGQKMSLDIAGTVDGSNQKLLLGVGTGKAEVRTVDGRYFLSGDASFWTEQAGDAKAADLLVGKYVEISAADAKEMGDISLGGLLKTMFAEGELSVLEKLTTSVETRTEGGTQVWVAGDGAGNELWVDPTTRQLVRIVATGESAGVLSFDSWDAVKPVTAPPAAKVVKP